MTIDNLDSGQGTIAEYQLSRVDPAAATKAGEAGTYVPQANKSGGGLFVLNTVTGEGWWTNGKEWKVLGKPE